MSAGRLRADVRERAPALVFAARNKRLCQNKHCCVLYTHSHTPCNKYELDVRHALSSRAIGADVKATLTLRLQSKKAHSDAGARVRIPGKRPHEVKNANLPQPSD